MTGNTLRPFLARKNGLRRPFASVLVQALAALTLAGCSPFNELLRNGTVCDAVHSWRDVQAGESAWCGLSLRISSELGEHQVPIHVRLWQRSNNGRPVKGQVALDREPEEAVDWQTNDPVEIETWNTENNRQTSEPVRFVGFVDESGRILGQVPHDKPFPYWAWIVAF